MENTSEIKRFFEEFLEFYEKRKEEENRCCSMCGKELTDYDIQANHRFQEILGYGSKYDGDRLKIQWCDSCFDEIIDYTARSREYVSRGLEVPKGKNSLTYELAVQRENIAKYWDIIEERNEWLI